MQTQAPATFEQFARSLAEAVRQTARFSHAGLSLRLAVAEPEQLQLVRDAWEQVSAEFPAARTPTAGEFWCAAWGYAHDALIEVFTPMVGSAEAEEAAARAANWLDRASAAKVL